MDVSSKRIKLTKKQKKKTKCQWDNGNPNVNIPISFDSFGSFHEKPFMVYLKLAIYILTTNFATVIGSLLQIIMIQFTHYLIYAGHDF